ncbi:GNAT family N-acetyltransferase [Weissella viridescens]|uniref:GNAT family N-acetyltransferase n=1 Tax=Weissella viridescens TaxID=1629 RepID=UPI00405746E4
MKNIIVRPIEHDDLPEMWAVAFGPSADLKWMELNGPYFNDPVWTWPQFEQRFSEKFVGVPTAAVVCLNDRPIGMLSGYFEDGSLGKWLEAGIVIYDATLWGQGIGTAVFRPWLEHLLTVYPELPHVGFTTWSGNLGMMRLGERSGMQLEGRIRKVRYWQGEYYDSIKYGILRTEI